jgi:hypothetical protein
MKRFILLGLLACCPYSHANEEFPLDYDEFRAEGLTNNKKEFVVKGKTKRKNNEVYLDSFSFSVNKIKFKTPDKILENLHSPYFALLRINNDSGIFGNSYRIHLPFGDEVQCNPEDEDSFSYREVFIFYHENGEIELSGISDACDK